MLTFEATADCSVYAYDGLERLSERKGSGTQVFHYGDLSDLPTYIANGEGKLMTSYVQGAHGLVEQRSGEATDYPLANAHGDITALTGPAGGVESRQEYGPWGEQLSGPSLEMGYLGSQERATDPTTGLIQMGARIYDPSLGGFASEDSVLGHLGLGDSVDRYIYVWDNPLNRYDLNGHDVCGTVGEAPVIGGVLETGCEIGTYHNPTEPTPLEDAEELGKRAQDFVKYASTHTFGLCVNGAAGAGLGINAQLCVAGNLHSIGVAASGGGGGYLPFGAEAGAGPMYSNAHSACELGGPFASGGVGAGEGIRGGVNGAVGTTSGNRTVNVYHPWLGVGVGPPVSGNAGVSDTYAPCASW